MGLSAALTDFVSLNISLSSCSLELKHHFEINANS